MIFRSFLSSQSNLLDRLKITLFLIFLLRLGTYISVPGVERFYLSAELKNSPIFTSFLPIPKGDSFLLSVFTLGILPNINASIGIQLVSSVFPPLKRLLQEGGELGQKKVTRITRYLTALIALQYSVVSVFVLRPYIFGWDFKHAFAIVISLVTGSLIILWLSEKIKEKGLGNGVSLCIFINIISSVPSALSNSIITWDFQTKLLMPALFFVGIFSIVIIQSAIRNIPVVSYNDLAKEVNEEKFIAFRLNPSGIMPLILTSILLNLLLTLGMKLPFSFPIENFIKLTYLFGYFLFTIFFSYFYSTVVLNPMELATNFRKKGSTIKGITPGLATMKFLQESISRISLLGGLFLAILVTVPTFLSAINLNLPEFKGISGTSILILSGVAVDLSRQIRTYSIFGSYDNIDTWE